MSAPLDSSRASLPEFSECIVHDRDNHVQLEWTARGWRRCVLVAEELIEQWIEEQNELRQLRGPRRQGEGPTMP